MSTHRDVTRTVRSWLDEGVTELPDRVLDAVLDQLPATHQRQATWWPARRFAQMSTAAKFGLAAAVIVVAAFLGLNYIVAPNIGGPRLGDQTPSPSPSPSPFPRSGDLPPGSYRVTQGSVRYALEVPTAGWTSQGHGAMAKGSFLAPTAGFVAGTPVGMDGVYVDPCAHVPNRTIGPSVADLAAAVAAIPGLDTIGPTDVTVGGLPAKQVVINVPDDIGCAPDEFFLWFNDGACAGFNPCPRWVSQLGQTFRVWIIDVDGERVWIEAETYAGATPEIEQEIQRIIDSIVFE